MAATRPSAAAATVVSSASNPYGLLGSVLRRVHVTPSGLDHSAGTRLPFVVTEPTATTPVGRNATSTIRVRPGPRAPAGRARHVMEAVLGALGTWDAVVGLEDESPCPPHALVKAVTSTPVTRIRFIASDVRTVARIRRGQEVTLPGGMVAVHCRRWSAAGDLRL